MKNRRAIDLALEILKEVPVLALAEHEELNEFVELMPKHIAWSKHRIVSGRPSVLEPRDA